MIAYLEGKLLTWNEDYIIINVNGVGYQVFIPAIVYNHLPKRNETIALNIHTVVREDAISLYGFLTEAELALFKMLITVSGIGPKVAIGILSGLKISALKKAILYEDVQTLKKIPGIGEKTAKRLILELKNKIDTASISESSTDNLMAPLVEEAVLALTSLGYSRSEAFTAVDQVKNQGDLPIIIKKALQFLGQGRRQ